MPTLSAASRAAAKPDDTHALPLFPLLLILAPLLTRAAVGTTTLPAWDMDPLLYPLPMTVLTPAGSLLVDALILIGTALLLLNSARRGNPISRRPLLLAALGAIPVLMHGWFLGAHYGSLGDQRIGSAWLSAIFAGVAVAHAARDPHVFRLIAASLLGFFALLAVRALQQEFIEHPATIADFKANRDRILAAHGWAAGSPSALAFERRAVQAEATGWFGLSNVFASLAAAGTVGSLGLLIARRRPLSKESPTNPQTNSALTTFGLLALLAACAVALSLSRSKGGILAAMVGFGAVVAFLILSRFSGKNAMVARRLAMLIGPAAILAPIALIFLRGVLADQLSELSLLFRSFYLHGALSIFAHHPVLGVGPDGFQNAYLVAKPPLSTEDVTSPHSIVFDYLATLGVLGLAWITLLFRWAWQVGVNALPGPQSKTPSPTSPPISRDEYRLIAILPAIVTIAAAYTDSPLITPDLAIVRTGGAVLWGLCSFAVLTACVNSSRTSIRMAISAGAIALLAHIQIDLALSWYQSAGFVTLFIALAAAPEAKDVSEAAVAETVKPRLHPFIPPLILMILAAVMVSSAHTAWRWQQKLVQAAELLHPIPDYSIRLTQLAAAPQGQAPEDSLERIARDMSTDLNAQIPPNADAIRAAIAGLEPSLLPRAADLLVQARAIEPSDHRPLREASRLHLRLAEAAAAAGVNPFSPGVQSHFDNALKVLPSYRDRLAAADYRWAALVHERRARMTRLQDKETVRAAAISWQHTAAADPTNPDPALRLMRLSVDCDEPELARVWADETLKRDALQRYDQAIRGLTDRDRQDAERIFKAPLNP